MASSSNNQKIAIAMSGGVDSSVAAALLVEKYGKSKIIGLTMKLFCYQDVIRDKNCCSLDAIDDAKAVCKKLGIAHYVIDLEKEFEKEVINDFISEYEKGRTPNPCIRCNKFIKFDHLLKKAKELGADLLATGHYARIIKEKTEYKLLKGKDKLKDQSYFLYDLNQNKLGHLVFPLGELTKTKVRSLAKKFDLITAQKTESQDICFVPDSVEQFLKEKVKGQPGDIVDTKGNVIGRHKGTAFYTIGQRKGLGGGFKEPMFVVGLDIKKNQVVIGRGKELLGHSLKISNINWISDKSPALPIKYKAKIRYQTEEADCTFKKNNLVEFIKLQKAITPGQSVVFYQKEAIIGGGIIYT